MNMSNANDLTWFNEKLPGGKSDSSYKYEISA